MPKISPQELSFDNERFLILGEPVFYDGKSCKTYRYQHSEIYKLIEKKGGLRAKSKEDATCIVIGQLPNPFIYTCVQKQRTIGFQLFFNWLMDNKHVGINNDGSIANDISIKDVFLGLGLFIVGFIVVAGIIYIFKALIVLIAIIIGAWISKGLKQ